MQCLCDGYFVLPATISNYLNADIHTGPIPTDTADFDKAEAEVTGLIDKLFAIKGSKSVDYFHKKLGKVMWDKVGLSRNEKKLNEAIEEIKIIRADFWKDVRVTGKANQFNNELEKAIRVADFLELAELMAIDALNRKESCGAHYREESVELEGSQKGEAKRNDKDFTYVAAWEYMGEGKAPKLHKEQLTFKAIELKQRNYK